MEVDITLNKLKYRNPDSRLLKRGSNFGSPGGVIDPNWPVVGTYTFNGGRFKAKTSNGKLAHKKAKKDPGRIRCRRRSYNTHYTA